MIRILHLYANAIDKLTEGLGAISMYLVLPTVFIGFANVVLRYAGRFVGVRLTSNAIIEIQWYLYSLIFFFGFAYILKHNINVRVDFWYGQQSLKRKAIIDFVGHLIALVPFCLLGLYVTYNPVMLSWGRRFDGTWGTWEMSPDPSGLPRAPIKTMILVGFFTLLLQAIVELIRLYGTLRDIDELQRTSPEDKEAPLRIE
ncbi:MAG: TRAP transporter small permease subunit [Chloroflexi bacterium]|nr:TRAP transporter small permease subunit [Ardenticatenaceae bacterium]MBL1128503.1 TRAP transporter small permease subunit [Chloroflexota bacterium]NOG34581.1 TRAP transporter small permease subunit [Chloroflexota bacterium]GIK56784.1 MAG: C4-dicarboxylate ABC transporter substrate-binding protein [Chloroflexota bacterium]